MKCLLCAVAPIAIIAAPAMAGDQVIYAAAPDWVEPVDLDDAIATGEDIVLYDRQLRLEGGTVKRYEDIAYLISDTQALQRYGTLQFPWLPDKGDLHVHRLQLIRGDQVIDLIANGTVADVIRREKQLERRLVDGVLTAVFSIPGMEVGDILRMSTSTTLRDQALNGQVQAIENMFPKPAKLGFGRLRVSWPENDPIHWALLGDVDSPQITKHGGYSVFEIAQPIDRPAKMPQDAPKRYLVAPQAQFGSFNSWAELAMVMAPHFSTTGTIAPDGPIAAEIARIMGQTSDPLERAALALQLVQDEVSYLLNGLDGGNYLPQSPEETWNLRYGDCKAKSLLLLAMLREMGIDATAVLVNLDYGDAVSISQPLPSAFDHMIVHAVIDGTDYWLDGTSAGTRLDTIGNVPNFTWALPLVENGSDLIAIEPRWSEVPDRHITVTYDMRAGLDLGIEFTAKVEARGPAGAQLRPQAKEDSQRELIIHANNYLQNYVGGFVYDAQYSYDEESGLGTIIAKGFLDEGIVAERETLSHPIFGATVSWNFKPDRARPTWRDIPYAKGGPYKIQFDLTYLLPDDGRNVQFLGLKQLDEIAAGTLFHRQVTVDGDVIKYSDGNSYIPGEIPAEDIPKARADIRRISSGDPIIKFTAPTRYWELDDEEVASRLEGRIAAIGKLIDLFEDDAEFYLYRAQLHISARQHEAALADYNTAIALGASAEAYSGRSSVFFIMGEMEEALIDAERTFELQGDLDSAAVYAELLAINGEGDEALEILDSLGLSGDEAVDAMVVWAELSGFANRQEEAWARLAEMLEDRPDNASLLNAQCWFSGVWKYNLEAAGQSCEQAVIISGYEPDIVDSRALYKFRQGDIDGALGDISKVLEEVPEQAGSRYLRGVIRLAQGDAAGREDIVAAERILHGIGIKYSALGLGAD